MMVTYLFKGIEGNGHAGTSRCFFRGEDECVTDERAMDDTMPLI